MKTDEAILAEHLQLIHKIAWNMHHLYGCDTDDLFSEGCLQYLLKRDKFNSKSKVKLTTFVWGIVWNALIDYIKLQSKLAFPNPVNALDDLPEYTFLHFHKQQQILDRFTLNAY